MPLMQPKTILVIVVKNTAMLDFLLPILWQLTKNQKQTKIKIAVLFYQTSKYKILRNTHYYSQQLRCWHIPEYDLLDFLPPPFPLISFWLRRILSKNRYDQHWLQPHLNRYWLLNKIYHSFASVIQRIDRWCQTKVDVFRMMQFFHPDTVFLDNSKHKQTDLPQSVYNYLKQHLPQVILVPHAPHHGSLTAMAPYQSAGEIIPQFVNIWMPFKYDQIWKKSGLKRNQCRYVGYPGFDETWLRQIRQKAQTFNQRLNPVDIRILFIVRNFTPPNEIHRQEIDPYRFNYPEFYQLVHQVAAATQPFTPEIKWIIKPHPSNDKYELISTLKKAGISNFTLSYEPIYALVETIDLVISLYSTALLFPIMYRKPVILINSTIQTTAHQTYKYRQLYEGLQFYLQDSSDLNHLIDQLFKDLKTQSNKTKKMIQKDKQHLRHFFPDGSINQCLINMDLYQQIDP